MTASVQMPVLGDDPRLSALWTALGTVIDPELGLDIVTLGLVYGVEIVGPTARVTYTLTTPGCPMERTITQGVRAAAMAVDGIERVDTQIVWEPAWNPSMIAPTALT
jgi:metal-sulfur cluster biosynthetic enzyme